MKHILLSHGSGGRQTQDLVRGIFAKHFANPVLDSFGDSALLELGNTPNLAFTTDSYVVKPLEFPGGDIGKLAVCGTINDLAVSGAKPLWLSCGFIIEEGLEFETLERIVSSMAHQARSSGVTIVCGDTKVVDRGTADGLFINTAGIGKPISARELKRENVRAGDKILINGPIADHGIAVMAARKELKLESPIISDCAALSSLTQILLEAAPNTRCMRDPTRGGVAATLNEWVDGTRRGIEIAEANIPLRESTKAICEMLGFDPLSIANEGKLLAVVSPDEVSKALDAMRSHPLGREACEIGQVNADRPGKVVLHTSIGTSRIVPLPSGELLPRIC